MSAPKHTEPKQLGRYSVYPDGRVYSHTKWRGYCARLMRTTLDGDGYPLLRLVLNGERKKYRLHRLLAELFLPPRPSDKHEVRHLDGIRINCWVENLAWGTRAENAADREGHGRTSRGERHSQAIRTSSHRARVARGANHYKARKAAANG